MLLRSDLLAEARAIIGQKPCFLYASSRATLKGDGFIFDLGPANLTPPFGFAMDSVPPDVFRSNYIEAALIDHHTIRFQDSSTLVNMSGMVVHGDRGITHYYVGSYKMEDLFSHIDPKYHERCRKIMRGEVATVTNRAILFEDGLRGVLIEP